MPTDGGVRKQLDLELFDEKEAASFAELTGEFDRDQDLVPMVLNGTGPVRVVNVLELEVPEQWRERYYPRGMPQPPTVSPEARKRWTDIEPDSKLVEQVPTEERAQWREMEAGAIDRRLGDMDRNWREMAQLCGVADEPLTVRILREEKLLPALERWRPVIGDKHFRCLCDKWTARLSAREMELRYREGPAAEAEQARGFPQSSGAVEAQTLVVGQGNTRKLRKGNRHDPLKALIGISKRDHPGISHRDLCMKLDARPIELPHGSTWQKKSGKRDWPGNYDCAAVHPLMDTYLSKIPPASPKRKNTK